jgi:hypothetical protein
LCCIWFFSLSEGDWSQVQLGHCGMAVMSSAIPLDIIEKQPGRDTAMPLVKAIFWAIEKKILILSDNIGNLSTQSAQHFPPWHPSSTPPTLSSVMVEPSGLLPEYPTKRPADIALHIQQSVCQCPPTHYPSTQLPLTSL